MKKRFSTLLLTLGCVMTAFAQDSIPSLARPLNIPLTLSGNFGELRPNHFHSGLDFKTQGRTGLPVYSVDDGYVSRIVVSPTGFGRAVYITHPATGLTSVYGHLKSFSKKIDIPVRKSQYEHESFSIDMSFKEHQIPVKRGEQIGLSGNAGSSGGPHLHLDIRDTKTGHALDPLPYFKKHITDKVAPEVRAVALYPVKGKGSVNGSSTHPTTHAAGHINDSYRAWGKIIPAIKAYDRMSNTSNIYGIKYLTLFVDGKPFYERIIDRVDLDNSKAINTLVDYEGVVNNNSWMMWTLIPDSEPLDGMVQGVDHGVLNIDEERQYKCMWIVTDEHGNTHRIPFVIEGVKTDIRDVEPEEDRMLYRGHNTITQPGIKVEFEPETFYDDCYLTLKVNDDSPYATPIYIIGNPAIPVSKEYKVTIDVPSDSLPHKGGYYLMRLRNNRKSGVDSHYSDGHIVGKPSSLGTFTVVLDDVAPVIKPLKPAAWNSGKISFSISDADSGIKSYRGEIDGSFALFELDAKTGRVDFVMDPSRWDKGKKHDIKFTVTDKAGNTSEYNGSFNW